MTKKTLSGLRFGILLFIALASFSTAYSQRTKHNKTKSHASNKELLAATWKAGDIEYTFDKNGTSLITVDGRNCPGTWVLDGKTLTITPKKLMYRKDDPCSKTRVFEVKAISVKDMELVGKEGNAELHFIKL